MLSAIIVAAGSSSRAGFDKVFAQIGERPVIEYSVKAFEHAGCVAEIIVVAREPMIESVRSILGSAGIRKVTAIVSGGERRQDSVQAGLKTVSPAADFVAVHDAARPLIRPEEIERVFSAAEKTGAAALALPVTETLKIIDKDQYVCGSIKRDNVYAMQTPQIFARTLLVKGFEQVACNFAEITDEVSAVQRLGEKVLVVPARLPNIKITYWHDLSLAELLLRAWSSRAEPPDSAGKQSVSFSDLS
jgi:2-C-methyl-D-erythritol 4-phosphate cytidylyltransferase